MAGLLDDYWAQVQDYKRAGSIGAGLLSDRPDLSLGPQGLLGQMQSAEAEYMKRQSDPLSYYQQNPEAQGLLTVAPEMDVIDAMSGGAGKLAMFMGAKALQAPKQVLAMADKMRHAGVDPHKIKELTGSEFDFKGNQMWELSDAHARLVPESERLERSFSAAMSGDDLPVDSVGGILEHKGLFDSYPDAARINVSSNDISDLTGGKKGTGGASYDPTTDSIDIDSELFDVGREDELKSVMLHEVQHAIQNRENLPTGASPSNMDRQLSLSASRENAPFISGEYALQEAARELSPMNKAEEVARLTALSKKENPQPRSINSSSYIYEYGDQIRSKFGPMPKKAGGNRDEWIRSAFAFVRNKEKDKMGHDGAYYLDMINNDPKGFGKLKRKHSKTMSANRADSYAAQEVRNRYEQLGLLGSRNAYKASTGERVARSTQAREGLSDKDRRKSLFKDWDIPNYGTPKDIEWALLPSDAYGSYRPFKDYLPE